jgi:hypothetical protein
VGLGNVDNTSDAGKPISALQAAGLQPLDSDLTAIAALAPADDSAIQRKGGIWVARSMAQVKADLALAKADVGLANVDNTSDASKPNSTAQTARQDRIVREAWRPTGVFETYPRGAGLLNAAGLVSGVLRLQGGLVLPAGVTITTLSAYSGTTSAGTPANQWFCLVDQALSVLAKTVDDTTTAWVTGTRKSLALSASYTPLVDTPVYFGVVVVAATPPSLVGVASGVVASNLTNGLTPILSGSSTTGLTNPASLGATAAALATAASLFYATAS